MQLELTLFNDGNATIEIEEWKQVQDFPLYEVSSMGRFRNRSTGQYIGGTTVHNGYLHIGLMREGKQHTKLAHRIVAATFIEQPSQLHSDVNHRNKVRIDNRVSNLEWMTRSQNSKHARNSR
jgi:hypothetical protein